MRRTARGQVLPVVMLSLVVLSIIIYGLVSWVQTDSKWAVKAQKSSSAINLAEAAIDRGQWKLQSTTTTWKTAYAGTVIGGYNFDKTYTDIPGGSYRIKFSSAGNNCVTIMGEGRATSNKDVRAISAVYKNQVIYSAMMSGGSVSWSKGLVVFWGPIMSQGNLNLQDDIVGSMYYPRKFARGVVTGPPSGNYPRDINGIQPPNTDNVEWWSEYSGVPAVPVLDFTTLKSSAAASGTLNVYGCRSTQGGSGTLGNATKWDTRPACNVPNPDPDHSHHFGNPWSHPKSARLNPNTDYVWYWDGDVTLSGGTTGTGQSCGLRGTLIVRGNLTIDTAGEFSYTGHVPATAWQEHQKLLINTNDTAAAGEYPADLGLHQSTGVFNFGTDNFSVPGMGGSGYSSTVGMKGFTYVGGNLSILSYMDFNGAVWVNGTVTATNGTIANSCGIFYDDTLDVPALNVILLRQSWREVAASSVVWL